MIKSKCVSYKISYKNKLVLTTIILFMGLIVSSFAMAATMNINQSPTNLVLLKHNLINNEDSPFKVNIPAINEPLGINWSETLNFNEPGSSVDYVIFGEGSDASDGQDSYDTPKPPAGFPPYIRALFTTNISSPYDILWEEYKHYPDTYKFWNLSVQSDNGF